MSFKEDYQSKLVSMEKAVSAIKSNDRICVPPIVAAPVQFLEALSEKYEQLENVQIHSAFLLQNYPFMSDPKYKGHIKYTAFFMGPVERKLFPLGLVGVALVHFGNMDVYLKDVCNVNVLVTGVSPMDDEGYMYFGPMGVATGNIGLEAAERVIVQVNQQMPMTRGIRHRVHVSQVDYITEADYPLPPLPEAEASAVEKEIAALIIPRVRDGSTIQVGLGGLSNAVAYGLDTKKNLSVHTEMITESMMYLAKKGAITGKIVGGFALGSVDLYNFAGESEQVFLMPIHEVNQVNAIAEYDNFVSINACLMADLTGQVVSENISNRVVSSIGGASDFVRGAVKSKGGQSFICVAATSTVDGKLTSNIKFALPPATPVTVQRSDTQHIVTEFGIALLQNRSIEDRIKAMIAIAHPDFRDGLTKEATEAGYLHD